MLKDRANTLAGGLLCSRAKITRETFLEAAYLSCTQDPDLMASVLAAAQQRYRQRKQGNNRSLTR